MKIHILSDAIASRIAAGEVVERPASVVKELIENSLDAGATEIFVWIAKSGATVIRVSDNGEGMEAEDLALAAERHATSKLKIEDDLSQIGTFGFRGEALPSIASVAKMEIVSRPHGASSAQRLVVEGGKKQELRPAAAAPGTTIEIRDIFFNTPARRKFLKSPATELSHVCDVVNRIALSHPGVHFRLEHDGRKMADYEAVNGTKDRLVQVLGGNVAQALVPFSAARAALSVSGFLSAAPTSFPNSRYLFTFVNRRYVRDKVLIHGALQGYDTLLMKGRYPAAVLFLNLPLQDVDVNVHPAKYEVRFRRQSEVHETVANSVREALRHKAREPAEGVSTRSAVWADGVRESPRGYARQPEARACQVTHHEESSVPDPGHAESHGPGYFTSLAVVGQILGCYIVCTSAAGLVLIDQHAAHERIAFEKLRSDLNSVSPQSQNLLIPQPLDLEAGERVLLENHLAMLERFGYRMESIGPDSYAVTGVPAFLPEGDYRDALRQIVAEIAEVQESAQARQHLEERLATIACHSVIRANRKLAMDEMRALLSQLDHIEFATQCPHGRPVVLEFSRAQIERMFKRS